VFCREAVADLARLGPAIEAAGTQVAFVHMGTEDEARAFFGRHGMSDAPRVSDPDATLYREFGLTRGSINQILGPTVLTRSVGALLTGGHVAGRPIGDPWQMPGVFLLYRGRVLKSFRHERSSDAPDYAELATPPLPSAGS
jgi:hypothetical protein